MSHWKFIPETEDQLYFLTSSIIYWTYIFNEPTYFEIIIESLKHCQQHKSLIIAGYVIMPNHLHLICAGSKERKLADTMRDFKHYTACKILDNLRLSQRWKELEIFHRAAIKEGKGNEHRFWTEGTHPILVDTEKMFQEKLNYMHNNPVRKGFVAEPEHWLYSSARNYILGDHSILKVECYN
ncbi:MAG: transposase [Ignavibacteriales bacterium]|nr:transposase [Ignavibacteriales bacterium]